MYKDTIKEMSNYINELVLDNPTSTGTHLNEEVDVMKDLFRLIRNKGKRKIPQSYTKEELFKTRGWGRGMKWTPYRQRLLSHPAVYDIEGEIPKYMFVRSDTEDYKQDKEYELWLELIRRQDKKDKKIMSKLRNKRIA